VNHIWFDIEITSSQSSSHGRHGCYGNGYNALCSDYFI